MKERASWTVLVLVRPADQPLCFLGQPNSSDPACVVVFLLTFSMIGSGHDSGIGVGLERRVGGVWLGLTGREVAGGLKRKRKIPK